MISFLCLFSTSAFHRKRKERTDEETEVSPQLSAPPWHRFAAGHVSPVTQEGRPIVRPSVFSLSVSVLGSFFLPLFSSLSSVHLSRWPLRLLPFLLLSFLLSFVLQFRSEKKGERPEDEEDKEACRPATFIFCFCVRPPLSLLLPFFLSLFFPPFF